MTRGRGAPAISAALAVATVVASCSGGGSGEGARTSTARRASTTTSTRLAPASTTTAAGGEVVIPADLAALVVDRAPAGYREDRENEGLVGPIDEQSLRDALSAEHAAFLVDQGFTRGFGRAWSAPSGPGVSLRIVYVLVLRDAAAAIRARDHTDDGLGERDRTTFSVPVDGAVGRSWTYASGGSPIVYREVAFARDNRLYTVQLADPPPGPSTDDVIAFAREEVTVAR